MMISIFEDIGKFTSPAPMVYPIGSKQTTNKGLPMSEQKQEWITTTQASEIMGVKRDTVAEYCRRYDPESNDNKIVCQKMGRDWFVLRESAERFEPDDKNRGRKSSS